MATTESRPIYLHCTIKDSTSGEEGYVRTFFPNCYEERNPKVKFAAYYVEFPSGDRHIRSSSIGESERYRVVNMP